MKNTGPQARHHSLQHKEHRISGTTSQPAAQRTQNLRHNIAACNNKKHRISGTTSQPAAQRTRNLRHNITARSTKNTESQARHHSLQHKEHRISGTTSQPAAQALKCRISGTLFPTEKTVDAAQVGSNKAPKQHAQNQTKWTPTSLHTYKTHNTHTQSHTHTPATAAPPPSGLSGVVDATTPVTQPRMASSHHRGAAAGRASSAHRASALSRRWAGCAMASKRSHLRAHVCACTAGHAGPSFDMIIAGELSVLWHRRACTCAHMSAHNQIILQAFSLEDARMSRHAQPSHQHLLPRPHHAVHKAPKFASAPTSGGGSGTAALDAAEAAAWDAHVSGCLGPLPLSLRAQYCAESSYHIEVLNACEALETCYPLFCTRTLAMVPDKGCCKCRTKVESAQGRQAAEAGRQQAAEAESAQGRQAAEAGRQQRLIVLRAGRQQKQAGSRGRQAAEAGRQQRHAR
eukprot:1160707-Pelagomonas_calceolata.AAC.3